MYDVKGARDYVCDEMKNKCIHVKLLLHIEYAICELFYFAICALLRNTTSLLQEKEGKKILINLLRHILNAKFLC